MVDRTVTLGTVFRGDLDPSLKTSISEIEAALNKLASTMSGVSSTLGNVSGQFSTISASMKSAAAATKTNTTTQKASEAAMKSNAASAVVLKGAMLALYTSMQNGSISVSNAHSAYTALSSSYNASRRSVLALTDAQLALTRARAGSASSARAEATTVASMIAKFRALADAVRTGAISSTNATSKFRMLTAELRNLTRQEQALVVAAVKAANAQRGQTGATNQQATATSRAAAATQKQIGHTTAAAGATNKYTSALSALGKAFKRMAAYMVAGRAIMLFTQGIRAGIVEIANFDQALQNLRAITSATDTQILGMKVALIDLAQTTKFSTTELAKGMVLIGQSGFDAAESLTLIHSVATLASATLSSLETSANLLTTTLRAFNLDAIESDRVMDVMANAVTKSKLTIDKLNTAFNYVGVSASQAGLSIEETASTMMMLANNGLRASTIGTGLRQVLRRLVAPNRKLQAAFAAQNIELSKVNPTIVGYQKSLGALTSILYNARIETVDMSRAFNLFGLRGAQAAAVIVKGFVGGKYTKAMEQVSAMGTALEMKGKQAEGLAFKFKNLGDVMKTFAIAIGDQGVTGAFKTLVDIMQGSFLVATDAMGTAVGGVITKTLLFTSAIMGTIGAFKMLAALPITGPILKWIVVFTRLSAAHGLAATSAKMLGGALTSIPFAAIVAGAGLLYFALDRVATAQTRAITASKTQVAEMQASAAGLKTYIGALQALEKEESRGVDISLKKKNVLNRLMEAYPELEKVIDAQKDSITELIGKVEELNATYGQLQLKAMVTLYKNTGKRLKENIALYDSLIGSMVDTSEIEKQIAEDRKNTETITKGMIAQIIHMGKEQKLSNEQIRKSAVAMAILGGASEKVAKALGEKVIIALREQGVAFLATADDSKSAAQAIVDNAETVISSIVAQSGAETKALMEYRKGFDERAKLLKSGGMEANVFRQKEVAAQIALYTKLVADRQTHHDRLINMEGVSAEAILAAEQALLDAKQRLHEMQLVKEETSYKVKLGRLKLAKANELLTEEEFNAKKLALDIDTNKALVKASNARLLQMVRDSKAQGAAWNKAEAAHAKIVLEGIELRKKLQKGGQEQSIALQMESLQIDIDHYQKKLQIQIAHGKESEEATQFLWDFLNEAQAKYNDLAEKEQDQYYDHNIANLKAAYAEKKITAQAYYAEMLRLELAHYAQIIAKADVQLKALGRAQKTHTDEYKNQLKIRDDARAASIAAQATFDKSEITAGEKLITDLKSQYDVDVANLQSKYTVEQRDSREFIRAQKTLFVTYVRDLVNAQKAFVLSLKAQKAPLAEQNEAILKLGQLEKTLDGAIKGTTLSLDESAVKLEENADIMGGLSQEHKDLAKAMGLTEDQLKAVIKKLGAAKTAGVSGAGKSKRAWAAFAQQLGTTVAKLKSALQEVGAELSRMDQAWADRNKKWEGTVTYIGQYAHFVKKFGDTTKMTNDALIALRTTMESYDTIKFGGQYWKEYNTNLTQYKRDIGAALLEIRDKEREVNDAAFMAEQRLKWEEALTAYQTRQTAHTSMIDSMLAEKDELIAKLGKTRDAQDAMNKSIAEQARDIMRDGMTSEQRYADDKLRVQELISQAKAAYAKGDYETAEFYMQEALAANTAFSAAYVKTLEDGSKQVVANEQQVRDIRLGFLDDLQVLSDKVHKSAQEDIQVDIQVNDAALKDVQGELNFIDQQIKDILGLLDVDMTMEVAINADAALEVIKHLQEATVSQHTVKITLKGSAPDDTEGEHGVIKYARGGRVPGVGTSDTVDTKLTPGEIVIPLPVIKTGKIAEFLKNLGVNFKVPSLRVPDMMKAPQAASGGAGSRETREVVDLNFNIGDKTFPVEAEASVGSSLIEELKILSMVSA